MDKTLKQERCQDMETLEARFEETLALMSRQQVELEQLKQENDSLKQDRSRSTNPDTNQQPQTSQPVPQLVSPITSPSSPTLPNRRSNIGRGPPFHPSSIKKLTLEDLQSLEVDNILEGFFRKIEVWVEDDDWRVATALEWMEDSVTTMVRPLLQTGSKGWDGFKRIMSSMKLGPSNVDEAWDVVDQIMYDVNDNPRCFVWKLKARLTAMENKFGEVPHKDSTIMKKLYKALPKPMQLEMEPYLDNSRPLDSFVRMLERSRSAYLNGQGQGPHHVRQVSQENVQTLLGKVDQRVTGEQHWKGGAGASVSRWSRERDERPDRNTRWNATNMQSWRRSEWCGYCQMDNHTPYNCPSKPPIGSCWACMRMNCRSYNPTCPGRQARPPPQGP